MFHRSLSGTNTESHISSFTFFCLVNSVPNLSSRHHKTLLQRYFINSSRWAPLETLIIGTCRQDVTRTQTTTKGNVVFSAVSYTMYKYRATPYIFCPCSVIKTVGLYHYHKLNVYAVTDRVHYIP